MLPQRWRTHPQWEEGSQEWGEMLGVSFLGLALQSQRPRWEPMLPSATPEMPSAGPAGLERRLFPERCFPQLCSTSKHSRRPSLRCQPQLESPPGSRQAFTLSEAAVSRWDALQEPAAAATALIPTASVSSSGSLSRSPDTPQDDSIQRIRRDPTVLFWSQEHLTSSTGRSFVISSKGWSCGAQLVNFYQGEQFCSPLVPWAQYCYYLLFSKLYRQKFSLPLGDATFL